MAPDGFARLKDAFDLRYYRWALADADRELRGGFPWLARIRGGGALKLVERMAVLSPVEQRRLMIALLKRVHESALRMTGEHITAEERAIVQAYLDSGRAREKDRYWQLRVADPDRVRVDRGRLLTRVKAALSPILGGKGERWSPQEWCWITAVGPWTLRTIVDVGGRTSQLRYLHTLGVGVPAGPYLHEHISFLVWLGIDHTEWDCLLGRELPKRWRRSPNSARTSCGLCLNWWPACRQ